MPLGRNVGKNIAELDRAHPNWSHRRKVAASLNAARAKGEKIPPPKKRRGYKRRRVKR